MIRLCERPLSVVLLLKTVLMFYLPHILRIFSEKPLLWGSDTVATGFSFGCPSCCLALWPMTLFGYPFLLKVSVRWSFFLPDSVVFADGVGAMLEAPDDGFLGVVRVV